MSDSLFERTRLSLAEVLDYVEGGDGAAFVVHHPLQVSVADVRARTGLGAEDFAASIGVPVELLREWERTGAVPGGPAGILLALLDRNPNILKETLGHAA